MTALTVIRRLGLALATAVALATAGTAVAQAPQPTVVSTTAQPTGGVTFAQATAAEYRRFIEQDRERYRRLWYSSDFNAKYFTAKADDAEKGVVVLPEDPARYNIKGDIRAPLDEARARLVAALDGTTRERFPALAAKAQVKYDCWVSRVANDIKSEDVKQCEQDFRSAMRWLDEAVNPAPGSFEFTRNLSREYYAYADFESKDQKDYIDSRHFARKGLRSARASAIDVVLPEPLARWNLLAETEVPIFVEWRRRLINALNAGGRERLPQVAAVAQVRFDCWVERTSERAGAEFIERCKNEFLAALQQLEGTPAASADEYIIYFDFDRFNIRPSEVQKITDASRAAQAKPQASVSVVGHTDTMGSDDYNMRLSFRRADVIAKDMQRLGVGADQIRILYFGKRQPRVPTGDQIRNQENRRTEIVIR
ncbi:MAG: OmpA family protein [Alphaproteobacteria bacterium]